MKQSTIMTKPMLLFISLLILNSSQLNAQGIQFASADFAAALNLAKQQHKLVFIDMYTDWCGPCKSMEKYIFPLEQVGLLYNANFINCRINAEKDGGPDIVKKYDVKEYPTFLFITPDGELISRGIGYKESADPFLELGKSAILKKNQHYSVNQMRNDYEENKNNKQFLFAFIERLDSLDLKTEMDPVLHQYCQILETPSGTDFNFLLKHVHTAHSTAFDVIINNQDAAYTYLNPDSLFPHQQLTKPVQFEAILNNAILESLAHAVSNKDQQEFNQTIIKEKKTKHQLPKYSLSLFVLKTQFYSRMKDTVALLQELNRFSDTLLPTLLTKAKTYDSSSQNYTGSFIDYLAYITGNTADKYLRISHKISTVQKALTLSEQALTLSPNTPEFLNTSARSYYLLNKKQQAIQLQKQAIEYSKDDKPLNDKFVSQLADMQAGKKII